MLYSLVNFPAYWFLLPSDNACIDALFRVSDKMVKKPPPNLSKKTPITSHHSTTLSPQPLQSERSFLHDKVQEKMKAKSPDKREKEFITLPEVKGAEGQSGQGHIFIYRYLYLYALT